ncbi:hypothetical protein PMAYCL1PPCAC_27433, partial [Pristionchus mayeri]
EIVKICPRALSAEKITNAFESRPRFPTKCVPPGNLWSVNGLIYLDEVLVFHLLSIHEDGMASILFSIHSLSLLFYQLI